MKRIFKIHKTFEDQANFDLELIRNTTPKQRLQNLLYMQGLNSKFRPNNEINKTRTINITYGYLTS